MSTHPIEVSTHHVVEAAQIEFNEGGNTVWVHAPNGATILRIKCSGKITVDNQCINVVAHSDMLVSGDIHMCLPPA